jgi:1,4-dihydroxy-6-naphthoate synthase
VKDRTLTIGFSPCPNDTFIFYALMSGKVQQRGLHFRGIIDDVETLNTMAVSAELDVTKVSYHALGYIRDAYCLLRSGGALGKGCGPLIVARNKCSVDDLAGRRIAVPGRYTTAFLLLRMFNPALGENAVIMPFHRIMESVKRGDVDAGVIIHESRFTYRLWGLEEVLDLGAWWEGKTSLPLPLGAIVARRSLGSEITRSVESLIKESIAYAFRNREETGPYVKAHSQEIGDDVIAQHIGLYVNNFSLDIGEEGERAIRTLITMAEERHFFGHSDKSLFIE